MKAIKVLHLLHSLNIGGAERLVLDLCNGLKENGNFVPYVCSLTTGGNLVNEFATKGISAYSLNKKEGLDFTIPLKLRNLIKKNYINILHTHNAGPWIYGTFTKMLSPVRLVHTEHSNVSENDRRIFFLEKWLSYFTDIIISDSKFVADFMIFKQKINSSKIRVIYNGVDIESFSLCKDEDLKNQLDLDGKFIIGNVARLELIKDHKTLISAFEIVKKEIPEAFLLLVGDGSQRKNIENLIAQKGLSESVLITGIVSDVRKYLSLTDLFVLSSLSEGLPLSLIEAMAAGKPVVATAVGGNPEIVINSKTGILVPPNDPEKLAQGIINIFSNKQLLSLGQAGKERVDQYFDLHEMIREYEHVYNFALKK